jgi:hypothetical protein
MYMTESVGVRGQRKATVTGRKEVSGGHARERNRRREDALEARERVDEVVERSE